MTEKEEKMELINELLGEAKKLQAAGYGYIKFTRKKAEDGSKNK